jgi:hypothetical protein
VDGRVNRKETSRHVTHPSFHALANNKAINATLCSKIIREHGPSCACVGLANSKRAKFHKLRSET